MRKINKNNKGVTLISLVVTIIVMIILAGISIALVFGERGIITKAKEQKVIQTKAEILEQLELQKTNVLDYDTLHTDLWKYIEHIQKDLGGHKVTEVIKIDDANAEIVIDGKYIYKVAQIENNVVINVEGYIEELDPQIDSFIVKSKTTNKIEVEAKVRRAEEYEFWILKNGNWEKERGKETTGKIDSNAPKTRTHKYENLTQGEKYQLKIVAIRGKKQVEKIIDNEKDIGTLEVANLSITVTEPDKWTKETKTITITPSNNNYSNIRYTLDGTIPTTSSTEYKEPFTVNKNCTIIALAFDSTNQIGASATNTVTKIDKLAPTGSIKVETTTNSAKVTVTAKDKTATSEDGMSGIKGYYYSKDGGKTYNSITTNASYTFTNLKQSTSLNIKVKVEDNAGNVTEITENGETSSTLKVANLSITVTEPDKWTNGTKTITITPSNNNYSKIRYTLDGTIPTTSSTEYKAPFTVNKNCTIIALAFDSTNQIGASATNTVTKIDKLAPTAFTPEITKKTSRSLTVKATVDDAEATKEDGKSGIAEKGYRFSKDGGENWTEYQEDNSYTFDGLTQTTKYTIKVEVRDNVGNTTVGTVNEDTQEIPAGNFTFTKSTNNWTNGNVTVTVGTSVTGYTLQTSKDGEKWDNTNTQTLTSNGTAYARLTDGVNTNAVGTVNVSNIDKTAPGATSITYNAGSNTCSWKNNYNLTLSSSDSQSGVSYYEIDWTQDGNANRTTGSNFVPENGFHTCTARFRAVDVAGNRGAWTAEQHIHMDTQAPAKVTMNLNGYSSGSWTRGNVTQTASSSDNVGISYYQYSHDGSSVAGTFPNPWTINWDGQWNFYVRAVDHAGNAGAWSNVYTIRRDTTAPSKPSIAIDNITVNGNGWSYRIAGRNTSSDSGSGINRYEFLVNESWRTNEYVSGSGWFIYDVKVRAVDNAGNYSAESDKIYLNSRRLYIRQLYYSLRDGPSVGESEVNSWDIDSGYGKGADLARIFTSHEANTLYLVKGGYGFADRMYRGILGRDADPVGRQNLVNNMSGTFFEFCYNILKILVNSTEAQNVYSKNGIGTGTI